MATEPVSLRALDLSALGREIEHSSDEGWTTARHPVLRAEIESLDAASRLTIEIEESPGFDARWSVELRTPELTARHGFWTGETPERLVEFFDDLARSWRGWVHDKVLSAMEHDFRLRATHDGTGHVTLWIGFGPDLTENERYWHLVAPLELEAGALDRLAAQMRAELTVP
ncbi:DUF6228 family protein [Solirubrobacter phytolaccae]|uniref:DUF6228 family protein n=1 Tax=Solirubrobacter phytolaccae TaxID=1404360 RepID=A0A9X3ND89_9ACTN|nr:DUF6228 family protein [Solirubrobacter phytolaccae]MDA0184525.1 DUF6228 family protein [Solirubrobacter phytolaccae]